MVLNATLSLRLFANKLQNAVAFLMTPGSDELPRYPNRIETIKAAVTDILPGIEFTIGLYTPVKNPSYLDWEENKARLAGASLVQYKPATAEGGPSYKVFIEDRSFTVTW
jgi:hypothetical protein